MISNARIAKELVSIARELTAGRRRMAWSMTEQGGINDQYAYIVLDGTLERGELVNVLQEGSDLLFQCGDALMEAIMEYLPESLRGKARNVWSPNFLEFLPSYFAGKDCVGYPMSMLGVTKAEIEQARKDEEAGVEYYDEEEQMSEREKSDRELNRRIESLTREIGNKSKEIGRLKGTITSMKNRGVNYAAKQREYESRIRELEGKLSELEDLTGESYGLEDAGVDTSMLDQDEWDF